MNNEPEPDRGNSGGSGAPLAAGVVLIVLGLIFLLRNLTGWHLNNWWALFILAPGLVLLWNGYQNMQADGRLSSRALQSFTGGSVMLLVSFVFLLGLSWGMVWPVFLIIGGVAALSAGSRST